METPTSFNVSRETLEPPDRSTAGAPTAEAAARRVAILAIVLSLATSALLGFLHRTLSGPGDELLYYAQAGHLIPFTDNYYGPGYFVTLRVIKVVAGVSWFAAGRLLSWIAAVGFLVGAYRFLRRVLPAPYCFAATILIALNPTVITASYSSLTGMFGAAVLMAALLVLVVADERERLIPVAGILFGIAALTRFQATGFVLGAVTGQLLAVGTPFRRRLLRSAILAVSFAVPLAAWYGFLVAVQGGPPANHNFVHLTIALGRFREFSEVGDLVREYGSLSGVLASPGAVPALARMLVVECLKFPFRTGVDLLLVAAGWLVPAACLVVAQPRLWKPWLLALVSGFLLTNIGARGWTHYYLPLMPLFAYLICVAAATFDRAAPPWGRRVQWLTIMGGLILAAPVRVRAMFREIDWPEWRVAREYLSRTTTATDLVTTTAGSFPYGTGMRFVDQDQVYRVKNLGSFVDALRSAQVTRVVVTERHSLDEHPELEVLLRDDPSAIPAGLRRDTLLLTPKRLAILTVTLP